MKSPDLYTEEEKRIILLTKLGIILGVVAFIVFLSLSSANAFDCRTHEYVCDQLGHPEWDCCLADTNHTPAAYYHHCTGGAENATCSAIVKAVEYNNSSEIEAHLLTDAWSPAHMYSLNSDDHSKFESAVGDAIAKNPNDFIVKMETTDKNNNSVVLIVTPSYMNDTIQFVQGHMNIIPKQCDIICEIQEFINEFIRWLFA